MVKRILAMVFLWGVSLFWIYPANVSPSPYGINVHQVSNTVLQKVKSAGIKWIRTEAIWAAVEPQRNKYNWTNCDRVINYAQQNDLSVLLIIGYTPSWANRFRGINYPPDNVADWEKFVKTAVLRYKGKVKYWNIWNEPNVSDFFAQGKDVFVKKIFLPAAKVIRANDPEAFIVGPELAHLLSDGQEWYFWMKYILTEAGNYIDVVSHHMYINEGVYFMYELLEKGESFIPSVKQIIDETGNGAKPFWITETGWNTQDFSENMQGANYLEILQKRRRKNYPVKLFFYEIIDDPKAGILPWGVLRSNLTEKPAYTVYKDFIAGRYPDDGGDDEENPNKKCYAEQTATAGAVSQERLLANLRGLRRDLSVASPAGRELVKLYNNLNGEFLSLALADARVFLLGAELLSQANRMITDDRSGYLAEKPGPVLMDKIDRLIALLKKKPLSPAFQKFLAWAEKQAVILRQVPPDEYLDRHLPLEIKGLDK